MNDAGASTSLSSIFWIKRRHGAARQGVFYILLLKRCVFFSLCIFAYVLYSILFNLCFYSSIVKLFFFLYSFGLNVVRNGVFLSQRQYLFVSLENTLELEIGI